MSCLTCVSGFILADSICAGVPCTVDAVSNVLTVDGPSDAAVGSCTGTHGPQDDEAPDEFRLICLSAAGRAHVCVASSGSTSMGNCSWVALKAWSALAPKSRINRASGPSTSSSEFIPGQVSWHAACRLFGHVESCRWEDQPLFPPPFP